MVGSLENGTMKDDVSCLNTHMNSEAKHDNISLQYNGVHVGLRVDQLLEKGKKTISQQPNLILIKSV